MFDTTSYKYQIEKTSIFYLRCHHQGKEEEDLLEVLPEVLEEEVMLVVEGIVSRHLESMRRGKREKSSYWYMLTNDR